MAHGKICFLQAINKLAQVMHENALSKGPTVGGRKISNAQNKQRDKEVRKLQQDIAQERTRFSDEISSLRKEIDETRANLVEEVQLRTKLKMELDSKDAENEQLRVKLQSSNFDSVSQNSGSGGFDEDEGSYLLNCILHFLSV